MDSALLQHDEVDIWKEVLGFRPHLQPGHESTCPGISDELEVRQGACPECRSWQRALMSEGDAGPAPE
jgi:hypothetical protein